MEIYVVGVKKYRKKIQEFRVICLNNNGSIEKKDVTYQQMVGAVHGNPALFKNIKIENGELKGVNGSLDRYGECGKSQALVIINEIKSPSGQLLGYFCSDTNGVTKELSEKDAITFSEKISIANGKVVPDSSGNKHLSCIEGSYKSVVRQQKTQEQPNKQVSSNNQIPEQTIEQPKVNNQNQNTPVQQNVQQLEGKLASLSDSDKKLIMELRKLPNYNTTVSKNIIDTISRSGFVSNKQRYVMKSEYEKYTGNKLADNSQNTQNEDFYESVKPLISELKTYKEYDNTFTKKIVYTVEKYKKCSEKQKVAIEKGLDELRKTGTKIQSQPIHQEDKSQNPSNNTIQNTNKQSDSIQNTPVQAPVQDKSNLSASQTQEPVQAPAQTQEQIPAQQDMSLSLKEEKALRNKENEKKKEISNLNEKSKLEATKQARKVEGRRMGQNIQTDNIFDYSLHKDSNGRQSVYIEGFHKDVDTKMDLHIPDEVVINNKSYRITGIAIDAFATTHITSLKTGKNIEDIGQGAFRYCSRLLNVDISESKHKMISRYLFSGCSALESIEIGNGVQRIHENAFEQCFKLKEITIPEICRTIARNAFSCCYELSNVNCNFTSLNIDYGAFQSCTALKKFDFNGVTSIGAQAFRNSGLDEVVLSGSIREIGDKAFADCMALYKVIIEDGVEILGEYVFAKSEYKARHSANAANDEITQLEEIYTPKSLKEIGMDTFRHAGVVIGYTGTVAESKCLAFGTPFRALDSVNDENSTRVRLKSAVIGKNPIEALKNDLDKDFDGLSNPSDFEMHTKKFLNAVVSQDVIEFLRFEAIGEAVEPHVKFKGAVNYLQDVAEVYQLPLMNSVLRLKDTFDVINTPIYDDGYNRISKITYEIADTLDNGSFIIVMQGNKIQFMCDCTTVTNIICTSSTDTNISLPVKKHIHSGDIIGENPTIDGASAILKDEMGTKENVGKKLYLRIYDNGIDVCITKKEDVIYVPAAGVALELHDRTKDKLEEDIAQAQRNAWNAKYSREKVVANKAVLSVMDYDQLIQYMNKLRRNIGGYSKFFNSLASMGDSAVKTRIKNIGTIEDEKEAHLFQVSKQFVEIVNNSDQKITPNLLTYKLLNDLAHSYWMISKDESWYKTVGAKSLNKTAEYFVGQYKLIEYKSNQIVKFSNPYMNGKKGAYVFILKQGDNILGVYTSRYNMQYICEKLYSLTYIEPGVNIPDSIMQNPDKFDQLDSKLFYPFYDVLQSKNGWNIKDLYSYGLNSSVSAVFNISMYKPTGVFYLTMSKIRFERDPKNPKESIMARYRTTPILPIGNMDRALVVATTTNTNSKKMKVYKELLSLAAAESMLDGSGTRAWKEDVKLEIQDVLNNYYKVRELILNGVKDVSQYKKLVDSRVVYMVGTIQKGQLQRETMLKYDNSEYEDEDDIVIEDSADELKNVNLDEFNEEPEDDIDIEEELEDDDEEIDFGDDEEDVDDSEDGKMTFEEFFETAKSMGITDETQARAMFISFKNQNK